MNITEVKNVYWVNDTKTRVSAIVSYDDGTTELLSIAESETSPFWQYIKENIPVEQIDQHTEEVAQATREKRKLDEYRAQEREMQSKHNTLFNTKIEAFDIPQVANASSARKSKIRKAKSVTEVLAQVTICLLEAEKAEQQSNV
jgi:hypothetical protein